MSEYMEKHNVSRLIRRASRLCRLRGGRPVDREDPPPSVRGRPLDEIEKAHPDVYNTLLQIMEEGRLTDSFGRNVDFKNTIIIMTTNAGAEVTSYTNIFGFDRGRDEAGSYEQMKERLQGRDREILPTGISQPAGRRDRLPQSQQGRPQKDRGYRARQDPLAHGRARHGTGFDRSGERVLDLKGYNPDYGARPLRRAIENLIENPLSEEILRNAFKGKDLVNVSVGGTEENKRLKFEATTKAEQEELERQSSLVGVGGPADNESLPSSSKGE